MCLWCPVWDSLGGPEDWNLKMDRISKNLKCSLLGLSLWHSQNQTGLDKTVWATWFILFNCCWKYFKLATTFLRQPAYEKKPWGAASEDQDFEDEHFGKQGMLLIQIKKTYQAAINIFSYDFWLLVCLFELCSLLFRSNRVIGKTKAEVKSITFCFSPKTCESMQQTYFLH